MHRAGARAGERALLSLGAGICTRAAGDRHLSGPRPTLEARRRQHPRLWSQVKRTTKGAGTEILDVAADRVAGVGNRERVRFDAGPERPCARTVNRSVLHALRSRLADEALAGRRRGAQPATTTTPTTTATGTPTTTTAPDSLGQGETTPTGGGGQVGLLLISPYVKPDSLDVVDYFNHFSLLASIEDLFGPGRLGYAADSQLPAFTAGVFNADPSSY